MRGFPGRDLSRPLALNGEPAHRAEHVQTHSRFSVPSTGTV